MKATPAHPIASAFLLAFVTTSCGGNDKPQAESPEPAAPQSSDEELSDDEADLLAQIEESANIADAQAAAASEGPSTSPDGEREIVYRVSQDGLKVQIEGAEFFPEVEAVKVGGRWGVKLRVQAMTKSERILLTASSSPLAFGGFVRRGEKERITDKRDGGADISLEPGSTLEFKRTWPGTGEQGLAPGEELELHVGLWGYGEKGATRPVRKFLVVTMVATEKGATPKMQPPQ
jgi:hypothetical protein